jgi:thiol-disulfide isomerase/thioredoxin
MDATISHVSRAGLLLAVFSPMALAQDVTLSKVRYDGLTRFVSAQKGKVVIVDFWATYCVPCKAAFPHLVEMHQKYAGRGLVVVSVSIDDSKDRDAIEEAQKFLRAKKATMTNFLLDEGPAVWQKKLGSESVPVVFVFNRAGQIEKKYTESPKPAEVDSLVEKLLQQKCAP